MEGALSLPLYRPHRHCLKQTRRHRHHRHRRRYRARFRGPVISAAVAQEQEEGVAEAPWSLNLGTHRAHLQEGIEVIEVIELIEVKGVISEGRTCTL